MTTHIDFHSKKEEQTRKINACIDAVDTSELEKKASISKAINEIKDLVATTRDFVTEKLEGLHFDHSTLELKSKVSIPVTEVVNVLTAIYNEEKNADNKIIFSNNNEKLSEEHVEGLNQASHMIQVQIKDIISMINGDAPTVVAEPVIPEPEQEIHTADPVIPEPVITEVKTSKKKD